MERMTLVGLVIFAILGFISWLGGGRKWAFRTMLSALILAGLGFAGTLLYGYWTDRAAERRTQKVHDCAIAKVAKARCVPGQRPSEAATGSHAPAAPIPDSFKWSDEQTARPSEGDRFAQNAPKPWQKYAKHGGKAEAPKEIIWDVCPAYMLFDNPTPEQEDAAIATAEQECRGEMNPKEKSLHEQISQYRREHGIKEPSTEAVDYDALARKHGAIKITLGPAKCAAKVRKAYPGAYDDLDDVTLTKKVLAKYPTYCDDSSVIPDIQGIR